ncbi:MAG: GIY-YIG nuclease family protein [candidate division WOR-3 bacterium]|nr:GIY-YIG nuclease family protein [candidate division WOR-3 bacterium]
MPKGTYVLCMRLDEQREIAIGKLGTFLFPAGYYLYVGSALGPGGLEARLARHRRRKKRPRWHIDYLLQHARLLEVWSMASEERLECSLAREIREMLGAQIVAPGFGSSDCRCPSHLVYFEARPVCEALEAECPTHTFTITTLSSPA